MTTKSLPAPNPFYTYRARVTRVVDGDTFDATVDLGFGVDARTTFRLYGIDTPETFRPKSEGERAHGHEVKQWMVERILNKDVYIITVKDAGDKYGRMLAVVYDYSTDEQVLNEILATPSTAKSINETMHELGMAKRPSY